MLYGQFTSDPDVIPYNVKFELLRSGGCYTFSCAVPPTDSTFLNGDEFVGYQGSSESYRGTISEVTGTPQTGYEISGFNSTLHDLYFPPNFNIPPLTERQAYAMLKAEIESLVPAADINDLSSPLLTLSTTAVVTEMSLGGKSFFDALGEFALKTESPIAWGVDATNRLYILAVSDTIFGSFHRSLQSVDSYKYNGTGQSRTKAVQFTGTGSQLYPPIHPNSTFENSNSRYANMRFSTLNLFSVGSTNGKFNDSRGSGEAGSGQFSLNGGASIQTYGTESVYELDGVGEYIELQDIFKHFTFQTANRYVLQYDAIGESGVPANPLDIAATLTFNGIATSTGFVTGITSAGKQMFRHFFFVPPAATTVDLKMEMTVGNGGGNNGVGIRNIKVFEDDRAYPPQWDMVVPLTSTLVQVAKFASQNQGLLIGVNYGAGVPAGSDYAMLRYIEPSAVEQQRQYKWSVRGKMVPTRPFFNDFYVVIEGYDSTGAFISQYTSPVISIVPTPGVEFVTSNTFSIPTNVVSVVSSIRFTSAGYMYLTGFTLRDARETSGEVYGDTLWYKRTVGTVGRVASVSAEAATIEEADRFIDAWLLTQNQSTLAPQIAEEISETIECTSIFGKPFRITETNTRYPIESVQVDCKVQRMDWILQVRPRPLEDIIARRQKTSSGI